MVASQIFCHYLKQLKNLAPPPLTLLPWIFRWLAKKSRRAGHQIRKSQRRSGGKGCSAHSPNSTRPGPISNSLFHQLQNSGFELDTAVSVSEAGPRAIEVYPHPALLTLLGRDYRVSYKVGNSAKYWRGESVQQRIAQLIDEFAIIYHGLSQELGNLPFELPSSKDVETLSYLKRYEDALDALVCAWVGQQHLLGRTRPYGDENSVIWVPE